MWDWLTFNSLEHGLPTALVAEVYGGNEAEELFQSSPGVMTGCNPRQATYRSDQCGRRGADSGAVELIPQVYQDGNAIIEQGLLVTLEKAV